MQAQTPGAVTADLILDPLGRLVAKRTTTTEGTLHRAYLHDGDQVVEEYASVAGQTQVQLDRRHHWGRWIDDLVAEQVDTDHDGTLETTLYPITDLLGSVELLTDDTGRIVERITYDPDGTPHFWGEDTTRPQVTQVVWTGNGQSPTGVTVADNTLVVRFNEAIHEASMAGMSLTLTPEAGNHTETLDDDGHTLRVAFEQPIPASTPTSLHLEGLKDRTGNLLFAFDSTFTLSSGSSYAVLADTTAPKLAAVIDMQAGFVLTSDEPVTAPSGTPLQGAVTVTRNGIPVSGSTTRLTETALAWTPAEPGGWLPGGEYKVTALTLQDLSTPPSLIQPAPLPLAVTHLATQPADAILAYTAPTDSAPLAASKWGQTTLFQGREWHADLAMYYYRARWYSPGIGAFSERDPMEYGSSPSSYQGLGGDGFNNVDPLGLLPGQLVGWVYRIEGVVDGQRAVYIGSAADLKNRLGDRHKWSSLIRDSATKITAARVYGDPSIPESNRMSALSARNEALRSAEESVLRQVEDEVEAANKTRPRGQRSTRILNEIRAARNPELWQARHQARIDEKWEVIKQPGARVLTPVVFAWMAIRDAYLLALQSRHSQYTWAAYVLEDRGGAFVLEEEERWMVIHRYFKSYIGGAMAGNRTQIDHLEFLDLKREAEALWGTTDWEGNFVPGLLNPDGLIGRPMA